MHGKTIALAGIQVRPCEEIARELLRADHDHLPARRDLALVVRGRGDAQRPERADVDHLELDTVRVKG